MSIPFFCFLSIMPNSGTTVDLANSAVLPLHQSYMFIDLMRAKSHLLVNSKLLHNLYTCKKKERREIRFRN